MAKVVITIEDQVDGTVKFESNPNFTTMMKMHQSGAKLTGAHGLAISCMNNILREKQLRRKKSQITIPKVYQ